MKAQRNMRLSDALRLSEELGCVVKHKVGTGEVHISHKDANIHLTLSNHGPGTRANVQVVLFSKLRRLEKLRAKNQPGVKNASIREGGAAHRK